MTFVLVHSPLVGPGTWGAVADELRRRGLGAVAPSLHGAGGEERPYWERHARAAARGVARLPADRPLVLVGHSGAGPLLPAIRRAIGRPVAGYIFVDAGIPEDGKSRLDLLRLETPGATGGAGEEGGLQPRWTDEDLREELPDEGLRRLVLSELRPQPLAYRAEPIPVFAGWPDAPCGYLKLTPFYDVYAERVRREGWSYREMDAGHFHMLLAPAAVAGALVALAREMGVVGERA